MYTITLNTLWLPSYYVCMMDVLINLIATITLYAFKDYNISKLYVNKSRKK